MTVIMQIKTEFAMRGKNEGWQNGLYSVRLKNIQISMRVKFKMDGRGQRAEKEILLIHGM